MDTKSASMFQQREDETPMTRNIIATLGSRGARIIATLAIAVAAAGAAAAGKDTPLQLADNAPDRYVVVPGDTLWGISGRFLRDPWRWPEVWRLNRDQIRNPHRIYPGDIILLVRGADGRPQLKIAKPVKLGPRQYEEPEKQEIPAIPQHVIEPFLSQPLVVESEDEQSGARIVATQEGRLFLGSGDKAYAQGINDPAELWYVYKPAAPLKDPETQEVLGYEAFHLGTAKVLQPGDPTIMEMVTVKQEVGRGSRLLPAARPQLITYAPHKPDTEITGRVIAVYGGVATTGSGGRSSIVTLSKGARDGVEVGHVLGMFRTGKEYRQRNDDNQLETVKLPEERYGLVFVFRVFNRVAYGLVMDASLPLAIGDTVHNP